MKTKVQVPYLSGQDCKPPSLPLERKLAEITMTPIEELNFAKRKLRHHPESQIIKLMASIREFGFLAPILIDRRCNIIAGFARAEAARRLGMPAIPTIIVEHLTEIEIGAYRIADNELAELSSFDPKELAIEMQAIISSSDLSVESLGFEIAEVDLLLDQPAEAGSDPADEVPEPKPDPVSRLGDLWRLGKHRLVCGSSLENASWKKLMGSEEASMSFVDAPFNVPIQGHVSGKGAAKHADFVMGSGEMSEVEFTDFNKVYLTRLSENLKDGGIIFACMDWAHLSEILSAAKAVGLKLINLCVWNKTNGGMGSLYRSKYELVLVLKKGRARHINNVMLGATGRYRCNVWDYAGANSFGTSRMEDLSDHPTVKPTALVADAIRDVSHIGQIVTDCFMGSGTTILAAERTHRRAYGIEIEPGYVDVAIRRWSKISGKEAILDATGETWSQVALRREAERVQPSTDASPFIVARVRHRAAF